MILNVSSRKNFPFHASRRRQSHAAPTPAFPAWDTPPLHRLDRGLSTNQEGSKVSRRGTSWKILGKFRFTRIHALENFSTTIFPAT